MQPSNAAADAWAATNLMPQAHTRILGSENYLGRDNPQLGSQVSAGVHELFAICPAGDALQLAFERVQPTFIAVHDVGINRAASLLAELAGALRQPLQSLSIRQQGTGVTLAKLHFIELPGQRATPLRLYSTAVDADTHTRQQVAQTLLAFSRLGVLLVGALPEHALATHFNPLRDRLLTVPWNNRNLLLVPQGPSAGLVGQTLRLVDGTLVQANAAPPATQTGPIWKSIHEAWSRLRGTPNDAPARPAASPPILGGGLRLNLPASAPAAPATASLAPRPHAAPAPLRAAERLADVRETSTPAMLSKAVPSPGSVMPPSKAAAPSPPDDSRFAAYAQACSSLRGAVTCAVFERNSGRLLAQAGPTAASTVLIEHASGTLKAISGLESDSNSARGQADCLVTLERQIVLIRHLTREPTIGMALVLEKDKANPMLMRAHLQRLEPLLDG